MAKVVTIEFNEWSKMRLLYGSKRATSRRRRKGQVGDVFIVSFDKGLDNDCPFSKTYKIKHIEHVSLGFVADHFYAMEGAMTPGEFIDVWNQIHPRKTFEKNQKVYLHVFDNDTNIYS